MKITTFIFINFVVSFISDIILNDLSKKHIQALIPYFKDKYIFEAGVYAGLTICLTLIFVMFVSNKMFKFHIPNSTNEIVKFCVLAFVIGYIVDMYINRFKIFGNTLDEYYELYGEGLYGGLAFLFSILLSLLIQKKLLPILK